LKEALDRMGTRKHWRKEKQKSHNSKDGTPKIKHRKLTEACHSRWKEENLNAIDKSRGLKPNAHEKRCMITESDTQCEIDKGTREERTKTKPCTERISGEMNVSSCIADMKKRTALHRKDRTEARP
jgi:hypothetical protein